MTDSVGPDAVRASDAEREEFARAVREAVGEGRLSLAEGEERLAKIYAVRFRDELPALIRDLPGADRLTEGVSPGDGTWGGGPRSGGSRGEGRWPGGPHGEHPGRGPWGQRPAGRGPWGRGYPGWAGPPDGGGTGRRRMCGPLGRHVAFVAVVAAVLIGIWAISASHFFWPAIPLVFLALGLVRHARWHSWSARR